VENKLRFWPNITDIAVHKTGLVRTLKHSSLLTRVHLSQTVTTPVFNHHKCLYITHV